MTDTLDNVELNGRSLKHWYGVLTTDLDTGEPQRHLATPCSRYGRTSGSCAWWAIAMELIFMECNGPGGDTAEALDQWMSAVVNDHDDVATVVAEHVWRLPACLVEMLDVSVIEPDGDDEPGEDAVGEARDFENQMEGSWKPWM